MATAGRREATWLRCSNRFENSVLFKTDLSHKPVRANHIMLKNPEFAGRNLGKCLTLKMASVTHRDNGS